MFNRIVNLFRGFIGLFISGLEKSNPEALLEVEKENLREQIAKYNQGLASHAGMCERLMTQVRRLEAEERELRAKTTAHLKANAREAAGQYALRLQTVQRELEENKKQLEQAETTYKELVTARDVAVTTARSKINALKQGLDDLKIKKAMAELTEMASGMVSSIGSSGDTLNRLHEMVEEEREKASGRVRVAKDSMDMSEVKVAEAEQKAMAEQALAAFAASEGMVLDAVGGTPSATSSSSTADTVPPVKSMGAVEKS